MQNSFAPILVLTAGLPPLFALCAIGACVGRSRYRAMKGIDDESSSDDEPEYDRRRRGGKSRRAGKERSKKKEKSTRRDRCDEPDDERSHLGEYLGG